jgi:hypothetical protein
MPLTFAYGANMDVAAMARRCPRSRPLGVAKLLRHRLTVTREGWLSVARDGRAWVDGVLWEIALADMAALDRFEGVGEGLYVKALQSVVAASGARRALVYISAHNGSSSHDGPGSLRPDYLAAVIAAARHWDLPTQALEALAAAGRANRGRA